LTRLLDLFLDGAFPKECLVERKKRLEATLHQLEEELSKLSAEINAESLTQDRIRTLHEFTAQVAEGLDKADRDFGVRRSIIKILDVKATLSVEDEKQVDYARYVLGK
jgi:membrane-bound lytic murein transglycosylase B